MSKKKDAARKEGLALAFFILKNIGAPEAFAEDEGALREPEGEAEIFAGRLIREVAENEREIERVLKSLSPQWLLDSVGEDNLILLRLAFACAVCEGMPPRLVAVSLINLAEKRARQLAFQTLYSLSFNEGADLEEARRVYSLCASNLEDGEKGARGFAWNIVEGVWRERGRINALIEKFSRRWRYERMGYIERVILRIAVYELAFAGESAAKVRENAMSMADDFGAGNAKAFIKGVVDACARALDAGEALASQA